ncbi:hypothetical protein UA08_06512 [Talaromyces atroroseus]|uniref:Uncharacterized protein n=1 Tax=Talaromyces atroroseus TaxID=1441469 RepID=A0A225AXC9_TALAT|nr:hypothetical protein UA08_06512 [Talaromyces atroroseus]OKL58157.1 hypothetical protein UA08_06512 [Talaromyces atroroseus]
MGTGAIAEKLHAAAGPTETVEYEAIQQQPQDIQIQLMPHQMNGVAFLRHLRSNQAHGILADEMGLGKTLQVLSFFQFTMNLEKGDTRPFLVICPLSVIDGWMAEIKTKTFMRAIQFHGDDNVRQSIGRQAKNGEVDILLATYETVVNDIHRLQRLVRWRGVVLDEGHRLKSNTNKLSIALKKLKTDQRIILTGTPIQNNLGELWSIFNWLYPKVFIQETLACFQDAFSLTEGKVDTLFLQQVKEFLRIIMLRRTKETAGFNLPPKKELNIYLPLTNVQRSLYLEVLTGASGDIQENEVLQTPPASPRGTSMSFSSCDDQGAFDSNSGRSISNVLMELRKICIHPLLVADVDPTEEQPEINVSTLINSSSKYIFLRKLLEEEVVKNKKIIIFSGFDYALNCCESLLAELHICYVRLDGRTSTALRKYNIHRFMYSEYKVFIMATRAGGEGITLTAAEVVVFLDMDFNPQVTAQAEGRAHRIGQTKCVTVYKICTRGTVEEQMVDRINKKVYLASRLLDSATNTSRSAMGSGNIETDSTFMRSLLRHNAKAISAREWSPDQLLTMEWESVLQFCTEIEDLTNTNDLLSPPESPVTPRREHFVKEENHWLSHSSKIQTGLFDGRHFKRPRATLKEDAIHIDVRREERRLNKERIIFDEEINYYVSKESTQCKAWEAVPTSTATSVSKTKASKLKHLKTCMICRKPKNLELCICCPQAYHERCVHPKGNERKTSFCIDCVDLDAIKPVEEHKEFEMLGYEQPKHVEYIVCKECNSSKPVQKRSIDNLHRYHLRRVKRRT